jgi:hypothetical protein
MQGDRTGLSGGLDADAQHQQADESQQESFRDAHE